MKRLLILLGISSFALMTAACNTVEGVGEDVEAAGQEIDEEAEENRAY